MPNRPKCKWLRHTEGCGMVGDAGKIIGNCGLLGGTAYEMRCETCDQYRTDYGGR